MKTFFDEISFPTRKEFELIQIKDRVEESVVKSGITNGFVIVFSQHTTGAIRVNEYEKSLMADFENFFNLLAPKKAGYGHDLTNVDGRTNAHSHLQSLLMNSGESIPLRGGKMLLGTWKTIFFIEVDGPRPDRKVIIEVFGE